MTARAVRVLAVVFVWVSGVCALAQTTGPAHPPLMIRSFSGEELYAFYCAPCHGRSGGGDGPVAAALKETAPDLRLLTRRNGGAFPRQHVEAIVANDGSLRTSSTAAHGSLDMPVWGPIFKGLDPSDALTTIRIANVVHYLESIQTK